jgi:hypothetical protein
MLDALTITFIVSAFILLLLFIYKFRTRKNIGTITITNNHDHLKKCHTTIESALNEIRRMQSKNTKGSERLNAYYSESRKCWLVGKSSLKK